MKLCAFLSHSKKPKFEILSGKNFTYTSFYLCTGGPLGTHPKATTSNQVAGQRC